MALKVREWTCPDCDTSHDRDYHAALNILPAGRVERPNACGARVSPPPRGAMVTKQEDHQTRHSRTGIPALQGKEARHVPLPVPRDMIKVLREGRLRGVSTNADQIAVLRTVLSALEPGMASWTWAGHFTYLVRLGGATILTDPVWSARISGMARRLTPPRLVWNERPKIDAVVISHDHCDHLDAPTIKRLPRDTLILCGASLVAGSGSAGSPRPPSWTGGSWLRWPDCVVRLRPVSKQEPA